MGNNNYITTDITEKDIYGERLIRFLEAFPEFKDSNTLETIKQYRGIKSQWIDAITLHYLQNLSYSEIGERLNVSKQAIQGYIERGLTSILKWRDEQNINNNLLVHN